MKISRVWTRRQGASEEGIARSCGEQPQRDRHVQAMSSLMAKQPGRTLDQLLEAVFARNQADYPEHVCNHRLFDTSLGLVMR